MYVLYKNTYQIECWKHSHPARLQSSAGNTVIPQDFEQWTKKERQDIISSISTWTLCNDQVDWVNVSVDSKHLDDSCGEVYPASYRGMVFQTMEEIAIYHDSQVARNHLEKL